jgi:hypothetical protein
MGLKSAIVKFVSEMLFDQEHSSFTTAKSIYYPLVARTDCLSLNRFGSFSVKSNKMGVDCFWRLPLVPNQYMSRFDSTMTTVWENPHAI